MTKFKHSQTPLVHATTSIYKKMKSKAESGDVSAQKFMFMVEEEKRNKKTK